MSHADGIISAPITLGDVNAVLGASHTDVAAACKDNKIKMWAKYKPVVWGSIDTLGALNGSTWNPNCASNLQWWKATDGNYGLSFAGAAVEINYGDSSKVKAALDSLIGLISGGTNGWAYIKPSGGASSPYRIQDFLQYNHATSNPIKNVKTWDVKAGNSATFDAGVSYIETEDVDISERDYIRPDDLTSETLYRCVAIFKRVNDAYSCIAWATGDAWLGDGVKSSSWSTDYTDGNNYATSYLKDGGTYYIIPFYSTVDLTQPAAAQSLAVSGTPNPKKKVITVPFTSILPFDVTMTSRSIVLSNSSITVLGNYSADLSVRNTGSSFTSTYETAIVNENFNGTFAEGNYIHSSYASGTKTFGNGTTLVTSFNITNGALTDNHNWRVYLILGIGDVFNKTLRPTRPISAT